MPELRSVLLKAEPDDDPPLDHLGEYRDEPGDPERTIDRRERGDMGRHELRYFVSATAEYADENYERMEEYARGRVVSYGIRAVASVNVAGTVQTIKSPALYGVASDCGDDYADEVASQQLHVLREVLDALGVPHPDPLEARWKNSPWSGTVSE